MSEAEETDEEFTYRSVDPSGLHIADGIKEILGRRSLFGTDPHCSG
jgi:hypothetical protein